MSGAGCWFTRAPGRNRGRPAAPWQGRPRFRPAHGTHGGAPIEPRDHYEPTRRIERTTADRFEDLHDRQPYDHRGRGRAWVGAFAGLLVGFVLAFLVVALGSDSPTPGSSDERVATLQADLEERDARIADLEAQLAEAEAAAGDRDEDLAAQRDALDQRANLLDERASDLDARERALDEREAQLAEPRAPDAEPDGPLSDQAQSIVDQVLERIRELFGQNGP